jgi:hypothetical protein
MKNEASNSSKANSHQLKPNQMAAKTTRMSVQILQSLFRWLKRRTKTHKDTDNFVTV